MLVGVLGSGGGHDSPSPRGPAALVPVRAEMARAGGSSER